MAVHNPLYTEGAVLLDTKPTVNFYAQLLQRQQAKKDALDQYYQKALTDVTPAGMRNKDVIGGWSQKLADWQEFAMNPENRKKLLNPRLDNYKTQTEFNQRHQDLINDAQRSKQEAEEEKLVNQHRLSGKWNPTEEDIHLLDRKAKSIYDASRLDDTGNEPDLTGLSFNMPEFTPLQETQLYKSATQNLKKSKILDTTKQRFDNTAAMIYTPYSMKLSNDQIKSAGDIAAANLTKPALVHYENIMHNPELYSAANTAYKQIYGSNDFIDSPEKMAKGVMAIHGLSDVETGEDKAINYKLRADIQNRNSLNRLYAYANIQGKNPEIIEQNIDGLMAQHLQDAQNNNGEIVTDAETYKAITGADKGSKSVLKLDPVTHIYEYGRRNIITGEFESSGKVPFDLAIWESD